MSFLQPILLAGLPLVSLPILIHLINRQRYRTLAWAAMMFLLDAKRMTRGMARLRYWLIMAMRMLAIAALIFAVSRPLVSGWFGLAVGGQPDTAVIVLDRSASMEQKDLVAGQSKRSTGLAKLAELINTYGSGTRLVLIENTANRAHKIDSPQALLDSPDVSATSTSADMAAMMQTALEYIVANQTGRTDVWVCSDMRENDWRPDDGRWSGIREGLARLEGVRLYLLSYTDTAPDNVAVRVSNVRRRQIGPDATLLIDVELQRESDPRRPLAIPLGLVIDGARSVVNIEMSQREHELLGHSTPIDQRLTSGWGRIELPSDGNPQDNVFYFVFAEPLERRTVIVSDDRQAAELLRLAAVSPAEPAVTYSASILTPDRAGEMDWDATSLVLWNAPLPDGIVARQMQNFINSGRPVICFPPEQSGAGQLEGIAWGDWRSAEQRPLAVASWRGDSDLLCHSQSGQPLPVGKLRIYRYCSLQGPASVLAGLQGGQPLLARTSAASGPLYFCATLPGASHSSLAQDGVCFYVMIQRALAAGAAAQGNARQMEAGSAAARTESAWQPLCELPDEVLSSSRPLHAGAYRDGEKLFALNRPQTEDVVRTMDAAAIARLLSGLDYRQVQDRVGSASALASEIWRALLFAMAIALTAEAWLCVPDRKMRNQSAPVLKE